MHFLCLVNETGMGYGCIVIPLALSGGNRYNNIDERQHMIGRFYGNIRYIK